MKLLGKNPLAANSRFFFLFVRFSFAVASYTDC